MATASTMTTARSNDAALQGTPATPVTPGSALEGTLGTPGSSKRRSLSLNSHMDFPTLAGLLRGTKKRSIMYPWEHFESDSTDDDDFDSVDGNLNTEDIQSEGFDDTHSGINDSNRRNSNVRHSHHRKELPSILSLYRIDLDYNVAAEVEDQLSMWQEVQLNYCSGDYIHQVVKAVFQPNSPIQKLSIKGGSLDESVVEALAHGLKTQQEQRQEQDQYLDESTTTSSLLTELTLTIEMSTDVTRILWQEGINAVSRRSTRDRSPASTPFNDDIFSTKTQFYPPVIPLPTIALQKLDVSQCEFGYDTIPVFAECLAENCHLTSLKMDHCRLDDEEVAQVIQALEGHPSLINLSLRLNYCETESIDALARLLEHNQTKLQRLDIGQQDPGVLDMEVLGNALATNTTLLYLDARENYVRTPHMISLSRALTTNHTLQELNLENCDVRTAGWLSLLEHLPQMRGLLRLWLKENPLNGTAEASAATNRGLVQALQKNTTIQIIDLPVYQTPREQQNRQHRENEEESQDELNHEWMPYLYLNRGGRRFLEPNSIPLAMWPTLLERANHLISVSPTRRSRNEDDNNPDDGTDNHETSSVTIANDGEESQNENDNHDGEDHDENENGMSRFGTVDILYMLLHGPALLER